MSKEMFLKGLQAFDKNFNLIVMGDAKWDKHIEDSKKNKYFQAYSRINIPKVKNIANRNHEEFCEGQKNKKHKCNCFEPFYSLEFDELMFFFSELSKTHLGLVYLDDFSLHWKEVGKQKNQNDALVGKIDDVLKFAEEVNYNMDKATIKDLQWLQNTLYNKHFTERQLFENLLCKVALLLNDMKQSRKVSDVTNCLIKEYFSRDESFTRATNIKEYVETTYRYYDEAGISLFHS